MLSQIAFQDLSLVWGRRFNILCIGRSLGWSVYLIPLLNNQLLSPEIRGEGLERTWSHETGVDLRVVPCFQFLSDYFKVFSECKESVKDYSKIFWLSSCVSSSFHKKIILILYLLCDCLDGRHILLFDLDLGIASQPKL